MSGIKMTIDRIKEAAAHQLASERKVASAVTETTPSEITSAILNFVSTFSKQPPKFIAVVDDPHGLYGWCSDGVQEKVRHNGGSPLFGWTIWEWPNVLLTAEYHCVWRDPKGMIVDITPKPKEESRILFVGDPDVPESFDFDKRPRNRRARLYVEADRSAKARARMVTLSDGKRSYEVGRAMKAGVTFEEWMEAKAPADPLADAIDTLVSVCNEFEEHFDSLGPGGAVEVDAQFVRLARQRAEAQKQLKSLLSVRARMV